MAILIGNRAKNQNPGIVRFATDIEASTGAVVEAAIKPYQLQEAIQAGVGSIIGPLQYMGKFDPTIGAPDLRGAKKGHFYKVSKSGTYLGLEMNAGDNMYISADQPENTVDPALIDIIDNTESISVLTDLGDVTLSSPEERQGLVYLNGEWVNNDLVWALPELDDVSTKSVESGSYTSSTASQTLVNYRDHVIDTKALTNKVLTLPSGFVNEAKIYIQNIGAGNLEIRVPNGQYFGSGLSTNAYLVAPQRSVTLTAVVRNINQVDYNTWDASTVSLSERQILGTADDATSWTNDFLNVSQVLGATSQGEVDRIESAVGLTSIGEYIPHTSSNFINGSTTMRSADVLLDSALKAEETARISAVSAEASARLSGDNNLQGQINTINQTTSDIQTELDAVEASVGINPDGSFTPLTGSNYIDGIVTIRGLSEKLDTEMARVEQLTVSGVNDLQAEVDNTQASLGGLTAGGTFTAFNGTTYLDATSTFREADLALDGAIKAEFDARVADVTRIDAKDADQDARLTALEGVDPNHQAELDAIELSVGLEADGTISAWDSTGTTLGTISNIKAGVEALDGEIETIRNLVAGGIDGLQAELDATQTSLGGLTAGGTITGIVGTNYIDNGNSFFERDLLLDTALKAEEDARILGDETLQDNLDIVASTLQNAITAETQGRVAYDGFLENRIADLETTSATLDGLLTTVIENAGLEADGTWVTNPGASIQNSTSWNSGVVDSMHTAVDAIDFEIQKIYTDFIGVYIDNWVAPSDGLSTISNNDEFKGKDFSAIGAGTTFRFVQDSYTVPLNHPTNPVYTLESSNITFKTFGSGTGSSAPSEFKFPLTITGANSIRNVIDGFQIEGMTTVDGTLGKHHFIDSQLLGGITLTGMQDFIIFRDCDIAGDVTIDATFAGVAYFINCDFDGTTSFTNNALATQVVVTQAKLFPITALAQVTPVATMSLDDQSVRFFGTHLSLPNAPSFTGNTSELNNDADFVTSTEATINAPVQSVNGEQGDVVLSANDIEASYTASSYSPTGSVISNHLSAIDVAMGLRAKSADLSDVALSGEALDVAIVAQTFTNYSPLSANVEAHLLAIDEALGTAGAVKTVNTVTPDSLTGDVHIDADDIIVPASFTAGYSISIDRPITEHFSAIDLAISLAGKVETINGVEPDQDKDVYLDGSIIPHGATITAWTPSISSVTISGVTISSVKDAFNGLNTKLLELKDVAYSGDYADLTNVPTAGINQGILVTSTATALELEPGRHYIVAIADTDTLIAELPSATRGYVRADGDYIRITNWGNGTIKLREVDGETHILNGQEIIDGSAGVAELDVNSRGTIHIYGFDYTPLFPQAWGVYYTSSVEFNTKGAIDGAIFKFDQASQKMVLSDPLSEVAYDGTDATLEVGATITEYTPTAGTLSTLLQGHLEGINERLGELKDASNIEENIAVDNFTPLSLTVEGYFEAIDTQLGEMAVSAGTLGAMQVSNGQGSLNEIDWSVEADNAIKPNVSQAYDLGSSTNLVRAVYTDSVALGTLGKVLEFDGALKIDGNTLKAEGAPLYDGASIRSIVNGGSFSPDLNRVYLVTGTGSETWTLPTTGLNAGLVIDIMFRGDCEGAITLNAGGGTPTLLWEGSSLASLEVKSRGNQVRVVFDGTDWIVTENKLTSVRGVIQYFTEISASGTLKVNTDHRSTSDTAITMSLPAISSVLIGDCVQVSRGLNQGVVTINPDAVDAGANAILTQTGYRSSFVISRSGDHVKFISDGTKWVTQEERLERSAEVITASPAQITKPNTFALIENALGSCTVRLPASNTFLDGDFIEVYAVEEKEITLSLNAYDSGTRFIYTGNTPNNSVTRLVPQGSTLRVKWEETNSRFFLESSIGTAGFLNAGTGAGEVVVLDGSAKLPAVDGSQLTGIVTGTGRYGFIKVTASTTATNLYHHSVDTTTSGVNLTLPDLSTLTDGDYIRAKLTTKGVANVLTITPSAGDTLEGSVNALVIDVEGDVVTLIANTSDNDWEIV